MMIKIDEIKLAYYKLKNHVYYDNSELHLRERIVLFETDGLQKESENKTEKVKENLNKKFYMLCDALNNHKNSTTYFNKLFNEVSLLHFPKRIKDENQDLNFVTNRRSSIEYKVNKLITFIDLPIELHIISVLWINKYGYKFDSELLDVCKGNRLIINKDKTDVTKSSGVFKPYFTQYQKWRDKSIETAGHLLNNKKNALFINLDIKEYFDSCSVNLDLYFEKNKCGINKIMRRIFKTHNNLSKKNSDNYESQKDKSSEYALPIGFLPSYIIANHYLNELDRIIVEKFKPIYYGRYVDDFLIVFQDYNKKEKTGEDKNKFANFSADLKKYKEDNGLNHISKVEEYIVKYFDPLFIIEKDKVQNKDNCNKEKHIIKIKEFDNLVFQSEKTLVYFFDHKESSLVIDKLKQELDYRSSQFKDLPDDNYDLGNLDKNAFYLNYSDSEGKVRTLKDYKENRFGLTIYLTNKILGATKHKKRVSDEEIQEFLKLFTGRNVIEFYRLWEKIFTYLLVNKQNKEYVLFYTRCVEEIKKINSECKKEIETTLLDFLRITHELTISLHINFLSNKEKEFLKKQALTTTNDPNSFFAKRYRISNMMRHHYISIPLLNYTKESYKSPINLIEINYDFSNYTIDNNLIKNSPRTLRFWECTVSQLFSNLCEMNSEENGTHQKFSDNDILDKSFGRFKLANKTYHLPSFFRDEDSYKDNFYKTICQSECEERTIVEIHVNDTDKKLRPKIGVANTSVSKQNIEDGLRKKPNVSNKRYQDLVDFLKHTRKNNTEIVAFPEFFIPIQLLSSLIRYSQKNQTLLITGLEHFTVNDISYNFVVTILPVDINGYKDATVVFRLKNHYSPEEEEFIQGNHYLVPKPEINRYHLFRWKNIYFSVFYCFELANISHRSLFKGKVDVLFAIEYNSDVNYFSNLVESVSRDLHCYVVQVNSSDYGDTRISQPTQNHNIDIVRLKGGENNVTVVGSVDIQALREFQRKKYNLTKTDKSFKPLPPSFPVEYVLKRIENKNIFKGKVTD